MKEYGYHELDHTADWAIKIWGQKLEYLLIAAAKGMYNLSNTHTDADFTKFIELRFAFSDPENLLVDFLSELIFIGEVNNFAVINYDLVLDDLQLIAKLEVANITFRKKEIKAVTFHDLKIIRNKNGFESVLVFDV